MKLDDDQLSGGRTMTRQDLSGRLRRNLLPMALDIVMNIVLPVMIYDRVTPHWGEVRGLLASSIPPIVVAIVGFAWRRRIDALSLLVLLGIALSLLAMVGVGSARMLQLREHMVTVVIGLVFLGSAAIGRPLIYELARAQTVRRSGAEGGVAFDALRERPAFRRAMTFMTIVWGFGLVGSAILACGLIFLLSVHQTLIVLPILSYATMGGLGLWTFLYVRLMRRRRARAEEAVIVQGNAGVVSE